MNTMVCFFCLNDQTAELRVDKKGRPYLSCMACGTRCFMPHPSAMAGVRWLAPMVARLVGGKTRHEVDAMINDYESTQIRAAG